MFERCKALTQHTNLFRSRGWARLGTAQLCLGHARAAVTAYEKGLQLDATNHEMQLGLALAKQALDVRGNRRAAMHE